MIYKKTHLTTILNYKHILIFIKHLWRQLFDTLCIWNLKSRGRILVKIHMILLFRYFHRFCNFYATYLIIQWMYRFFCFHLFTTIVCYRCCVCNNHLCNKSCISAFKSILDDEIKQQKVSKMSLDEVITALASKWTSTASIVFW